jgi:hypothetical protein
VRDRRAGQPHWTHGERVLLAERYDDLILRWRFDGHALGHGSRATPSSPSGILVHARSAQRPAVREKGSTSRSPREAARSRSRTCRCSAYMRAGVAPGRFHDLDLPLARVSYLFPIPRGLEVDALRMGSVYDVWNDRNPIRSRLRSASACDSSACHGHRPAWSSAMSPFDSVTR